MKKYLFLPITLIFLLGSCSKKEPYMKVGLVADPQYANQPTLGKRQYRESLWKLEQAIDTFNFYKVDIVQNLGDVIDVKWESYDAILPIYDKLTPGIENYHLLGNHEFAVDSTRFKEILERLSMPNYYYSYSKEGWRFIVLDATDYAYYSNSLHDHNIREIDLFYENTKGRSNNQRWNSAIGKAQQNWLKKELDKANLLKQKVILFSHMPLRPQNDPHNLWNDHEIIDIIEQSSNVVAFINGHNHSGNHEFQNGVHYITIFGMVDTMISSYGILEFYNDSLVLKGFGNQKNIIIK
jgi:manganese-dependent ADP-ribose/CDP-alcohol diphosphatase